MTEYKKYQAQIYDFKVSIKDAKNDLLNQEKLFLEVLRHGTLLVQIYKPEKIDKQPAHSRDGVYIIVSGKGSFYCDGKTVKFEKDDFIFVPAGKEHWFEDFTDDFYTLVLYYGPEGGEKP